MHSHLLRAALLVAASSPFAAATDLNLSARVGGSSAVTAAPGSTLSYQIVGELSDAGTQGLAMVSFDLDWSAGPLAQAAAPASFPMLNFAAPLGFSNPQGFGGTLSGGNLLQVGGAQNTINNTVASIPSGSVILGVAQNGAPQVLAQGTIVVPDVGSGALVLSISNVIANGVRLGESGTPFWAVDAVEAGTVTNLTVDVRSLTGNTASISLSAGGTQALTLAAGSLHAGETYLALGSTSGSAPGTQISPGVVLPLNFDAYTLFTLSNPNAAPLFGGLGTLNGAGQALASFAVPAGTSPSLVGLSVNHAYVLLPALTFVSNAEPVTLAL
jgi:hypothetical protein